MTAVGIPIGAPHTEDLTFDHLPDLWDLLPPDGGVPGILYAQVCAHNARHAQATGLRPIRGAVYYSISGPKGQAAMVLMGKGSPIPGASPCAGARELFTDSEVTKLTGFPLSDHYTLTLREEPNAPVNGPPKQRAPAPPQ